MERGRREGIGALSPSDARHVNEVCERYEAASLADVYRKALLAPPPLAGETAAA